MGCRWEETHDCQFCVLDCPERHTSINIEALEQMASVPTPRQRDEIDEWLEKECHIYAGACSSVENLKYSTAREVAEKLWKKEEPVNEDLAKAAQIYAASLVLNGAVSDLTVKQLREVADKCFKAGAKWQASRSKQNKVKVEIKKR